MNTSLKTWIQTELETLKQSTGKAKLFHYFFRLQQLSAVVGLLATLGFTLYALSQFYSVQSSFSPEVAADVSASLPTGSFFLLAFSLLITIAISAAYFVCAEVGLRMCHKKRFAGTVIGLVLSVLSIFSYWFPVGLFGLYCFVNRAFQAEQNPHAPEGYAKAMSAIKI